MLIAFKHVYNDGQCANAESCNSYRLDDPALEPRQWEGIPSSLKVQTGPEAHLATYSLYTVFRSPEKSSRSVTFNTKHYLSLTLRTNGALHPLPPLYAFTVYTGKPFLFNLLLHFQCHET
jgi:hypothetical protein